MIGKTLAHYQIMEKLGEGGMGVVYKTRDTHLDRFAAIKILPSEKIADSERKRRFVQEARAASGLNHPNIITIYGIDQVDGIDFIAMEYVDGKTLDHMIPSHGMRLNEALKAAVQIADALARAHAAGIIHRDLKPSNVMMDKHGLIKVLDFGLAKLTEALPAENITATLTANPTSEEGQIVGTVAYMSPEQAEGKRLDARSDIFSFGSVLYEMFTGRRAFQGETKASTIAAILREEPKPLSQVAESRPHEVERIVRRCLRKDVRRRFQTMADLKVALEELKEESDSGALAKERQTPKRRKNTLAVVGLGLLVIAALGAAVWFFRLASHPSAAPRTIPLTSYPGTEIDPALSPDGKQVAFAWNGETGNNFDIYVKLIDAGAPLRLTNSPAEDRLPAWSPDGRYIAFYRLSGDRAAIYVVPALGGAERKVGESGLPFNMSLSWSPDGRYLAITDKSSPQAADGVFLLSVETGEKRPLTSPSASDDYGASFSPNGRTVAFLRSPAVSEDLYLLSLGADGAPKGEPRRLTFDNRSILSHDWAEDGQKIVFESDRTGDIGLWAIPVSGGAPERLGISFERFPGVPGRYLSVSRYGRRLAYTRSSYDRNLWRVPGPQSDNRKAAPAKWIASTLIERDPHYSPDGRKIAFATNRSGSFEIWICDSDGLNPAPLTSYGGLYPGSPRWSPNSRRIAFDLTQAGSSDIYIVAAEGGAPRRFTKDSGNNVRPSWSWDGRWIYFRSNRGGDAQIWKAPVAGGSAVQLTHGGGEEAFESDDGKFVYYGKLNVPGIWRVPAEGGREEQVLDRSGVNFWALTSRGICFFAFETGLGPTLNFYDFGSRRAIKLRELPKGTIIPTFDTAISATRDGQWILYTQSDQAGSDLVLVDNYH